MSDRFIMAWFIEAIATPVMYCVISVNSRPIFIYIEFGDQIQSPLGFAILDKAAALGLATRRGYLCTDGPPSVHK